MKNLIIAIILIFAGVSQAYSQDRLVVNTISNGTNDLVHVYTDGLEGLAGTGTDYARNRRDVYTRDASRSYTLEVSGNTFIAGDGTRYSILATQDVLHDDFRDLYGFSIFEHFGAGIIYQNGLEIDNEFLEIPGSISRVWRYFRGSVNPTLSSAVDFTGVERATGNTVTYTYSGVRGFYTIEGPNGYYFEHGPTSDWRTPTGSNAAQQVLINELCRIFVNNRCPGQ